MEIKLNTTETEKLKDDGYVITEVNLSCCKNEESLSLENLNDTPDFRNTDLKIYDFKNDDNESNFKVAIYDNKSIDLKPFYNTADIISFVTEKVSQKKKDFVFRGHKDANYKLVSSILRNENSLSRESDLYYDIIKAQPQSFYNAKYHLDYLKVMQHYFADTRIMDVSTNILPVIYFAVENMRDTIGEIIMFDKSSAPEMVKRLNSDTVEILASLAALDNDLKRNIETTAAYCVQTYVNYKDRIEVFNEDYYVKKLVHEVGQVRLNFSGVIDPKHLFDVYFSDSTFDNERITNQAGEFIIHGFTSPGELNEKLNKVRYQKDDKKVILLVDDKSKKRVKEELNILGIRESTIYPSLQNIITDIKNN